MTRPSLGSRWALVLAFLVLIGFFAVTFSFRRVTDTELNSYQTRALVKHGDVALERYPRVSRPAYFAVVHGEHRYSIYGVGVSVLAAPAYAILTRFDVSDRVLQGSVAILFVAVSVILMFVLLSKIAPPDVAAAGTMVFGFGTTIWPLASMAFFQHGPVAMFQIIGMIGFFSSRRRGPVIAGFGFAAAVFMRPPAAIPLLFVGLFYLFREWRSLGWYVAGSVVPLAGLVLQNRWLWGSWLKGGYSEAGVGFHAHFWSAMFGLLFGWWRGLFVYSPVLILGFVGFGFACRRRGRLESRLVVLGASAIATIVFYASWTTWWNGSNQFGYRYLLDAVPFLVVLGVYASARSERARKVAVPLGVLSILTMTWGAAPSFFGFDAVKFASRIEDTSFGQAWIVFGHHPLQGFLRLTGVALIGAMFLTMARARGLGGSKT